MVSHEPQKRTVFSVSGHQFFAGVLQVQIAQLTQGKAEAVRYRENMKPQLHITHGSVSEALSSEAVYAKTKPTPVLSLTG